MKPAFFTRITVGDVSLDLLLTEYLEWALGFGRFARLRRSRQSMGVPQSLTVASLAISGDHLGTNDCSLSVRRGDGVALLRLIHRDADDGGILWHNVVRLTTVGRGVRVEHAVVRSAPRDTELDPLATSPSIVNEIITQHSRGGLDPRDLYSAKTTCEDIPATEAFVRHVLLDRGRAVPVLVVTPFARTEGPVVDLELLTKQLRGMAMVAELRSHACAVAFTHELELAGFDRSFACFDGGVRLYMPRLAPNDPLYVHPLWIRSWLTDLARETRDRTELLAGLVAGRIAEATMPSGLMTSLQEFDRQERRRHAEQLLAAQSVNPANSADAVRAQDAQNTALEAALRHANEMMEEFERENASLEERLGDAQHQLAELQVENQLTTLKAETLEQSLGQVKQRDAAAGVPDDVRTAIAAMLADKLTPESALLLVVATWPDRLVVLDSAYKSAKQSEAFNQPRAALELLTKLSTKYYEVLISGRGDHEARRVFGTGEFAAKEADSLTKNGVKRRTFVYKGKPVEMFSHLKIGRKESDAATMRIHFHWDADDRKLVIGHCGPHLNFD